MSRPDGGGRRKGNVLIVGYPENDLAIARSLIPAENGYGVYWFSWWPVARASRLHRAKWLSGIITPPFTKRGSRPLAWWTLRRTFLRLRPCVVHVHYALSPWPQAGWLGRLHPLVVTVMGGDIMEAQHLVGETAEPTRHLLQQADVVTSKSRYMDETLRVLGVTPDRIHRITWGMDAAKFRPSIDVESLRAHLRIGAEDVVFFCARVCEPRANKDVVVRAFARYLESGSAPAVLLVSEYHAQSTYCAAIHELVKGLGISERVRFLGVVPAGSMPEFLNLSDAVVSVPSSDGMPQTLYQAMACGCYPIASDIPQISELVEMGCEMSLVKVGDADGLADAMTLVASDHRGARAKGLSNRERILPVADASKQSAEMVRIYEELLAGGHKREVGM